MLTIQYYKGSGNDSHYEYIKRNPNTFIYGTPRFMSLIGIHLDAQPGWLVATNNDEIVGLLPFMKKNGYLGPVFNSLAYYGSNGGVIQHSNNEEAKAYLISEFYKMAEDERCASATIITNPLENDSEFYNNHTGYDLIDERIGQITHFPNNIKQDELMSIFQDPRPRNIRRAIREGIEVTKRQDDESMKFLFLTHVANIEAIGGLTKKQSFFELLPQIMEKNDWNVYLGTINEKPVAALLVFYFNKTVEYFTPVVLESYRNTQALSLVIYRAMQDAHSAGYKNWNWGGTWLSQSGVYDFKKRWSTTDYPYFYYTRIYNENVKTQTKDIILKEYEGFYVIPFSELRKG